MSTIATLGRLAVDTAVIRSQLDVLGRQAVDGRKGDFYGDIAPAGRLAIDLRGEIARRDTYAVAAERTLGRVGTAQEVLTRLTTIAQDLSAEAMRLTTDGLSGVQVVAEMARSALEEVAALLNAQQGGEYLFGGSDTANPPIPDAAGIATGDMAARIAAAVAGLTDATVDDVLAETAAAVTDPADSPFSAFLLDPLAGGSEPRRTLPVGDGESVAYGLFANRNAAATSRGETVGSWAGDLMRGLATLAALTPDQVAEPEALNQLLSSVQGSLNSAAAALAEESAALGHAQTRMEAARTRHADLTVALKGQLASVEEVDLAEVLSALQQTKLRLEVSYQVIGTVGQLSLAHFLR